MDKFYPEGFMHDTTDGADKPSLRALEESLDKGKILEAVVT